MVDLYIMGYGIRTIVLNDIYAYPNMNMYIHIHIYIYDCVLSLTSQLKN